MKQLLLISTWSALGRLGICCDVPGTCYIDRPNEKSGLYAPFNGVADYKTYYNEDQISEFNKILNDMTPTEKIARKAMCTAIGLGAIWTGKSLILKAAGFGKKGPVKGRMAPTIQSLMDRKGISKLFFSKAQSAGMTGVSITTVNIVSVALFCGLDPEQVQELSKRSYEMFEGVCGNDGRDCIDKVHTFGNDVLGEENYDTLVDFTKNTLEVGEATVAKARKVVDRAVDSVTSIPPVKVILETVDDTIENTIAFASECSQKDDYCHGEINDKIAEAIEKVGELSRTYLFNDKNLKRLGDATQATANVIENKASRVDYAIHACSQDSNSCSDELSKMSTDAKEKLSQFGKDYIFNDKNAERGVAANAAIDDFIIKVGTEGVPAAKKLFEAAGNEIAGWFRDL